MKVLVAGLTDDAAARWSRDQFQRDADRPNDCCQIRLLACVDVDSLADVERRKMNELLQTGEDVGGGRSSVEATGVASPVNETTRGHVQIADAVDVDHVV